MGEALRSSAALFGDLARLARSGDCLALLTSLAAGTGEDLSPPIADDLRLMSIRATRWRRAQREIFPKAALNESCWDILLHCFGSHIAGHSNCVKQIQHELDESNTSLLRRLRELEQAGMIVRRRDRVDGRRTIVDLTGEGAAAMIRYFEVLADDLSARQATPA